MRTTSFSSRLALAGAGLLLGATGCGGAHDALRGEAPTAAQATGRATIKAVEGASSPLVVDWKAAQRADLEEAIHDGVAIVAWDDQGLRLLKRCHLHGDYGYLPVQVKKDIVRLETADEVRASLPLGGLGLAGKLGGEMEKGKTLDIALAMVGKRRTTWNDVKTDDLVGTCDGATHYVRAILVGAFAMKTGVREKVAAAAEVFGVGAGTSGSSEKDVSTQDGRVEDCDKATGEEAKPPGQCAALLRIELEPIAKGGAVSAAAPPKPGKDDKHEPKSEVADACPPGFVSSGGACKQQKPDLPHACAPSDAADCQAQCDKGNAASCDRFGTLVARGRAQSSSSPNSYFDKACQGADASGCTNLGLSLLWGRQRDPSGAMKALTAGCLYGNARACEIAGEVWLEGYAGPKDAQKALRFFSKGCDGGDYVACTNAGFLFTGGGGAGVARDDVKAVMYGRRACFGGEAVACGNIGYKVELGEGVPAAPDVAAALYERACKLSPAECFRAGLLYEAGAKGVAHDDAKAKAYLDKSCRAGGSLSGLACVVATAVYSGGSGAPGGAAPAMRGAGDHATVGGARGSLDHAVQIMRPQCDQKEGRACTFLGIAEYGLGQKSDAHRDLAQGCAYHDGLGCDLAKKLK